MGTLRQKSDWWQSEASRLKADSDAARETLSSALSSVQTLKHDKRSLSEQIADFIARYKHAERALDHSRNALEGVTAALQKATDDADRAAESARADRRAIVQACDLPTPSHTFPHLLTPSHAFSRRPARPRAGVSRGAQAAPLPPHI